MSGLSYSGLCRLKNIDRNRMRGEGSFCLCHARTNTKREAASMWDNEEFEYEDFCEDFYEEGYEEGYRDGRNARHSSSRTPSSSGSGGCYVATAVYGSYDCPEVWTLRSFRDYYLARRFWGRCFIRAYYAVSPTLVRWFGDTSWFKHLWKGKLDDTQLSIILISLITLGFSEVLTSDFPRSRLRFFRTLDFGFSEVWISAARRLRFRCILVWFVLHAHEA